MPALLDQGADTADLASKYFLVLRVNDVTTRGLGFLHLLSLQFSGATDAGGMRQHEMRKGPVPIRAVLGMRSAKFPLNSVGRGGGIGCPFLR